MSAEGVADRQQNTRTRRALRRIVVGRQHKCAEHGEEEEGLTILPCEIQAVLLRDWRERGILLDLDGVPTCCMHLVDENLAEDSLRNLAARG